MTRGAAIVMLLVGLAACGTATPGLVGGWPRLEGGRDLPPVGEYQGVPGPNGGTLLEPASLPIDHGVAFRFALGHCGVLSPVDLDGSFWEAIEGTSAAGAPIGLATDAEMTNQTAGTVAVIGNQARFRTDRGTLVRLERHDGAKEFPGCD